MRGQDTFSPPEGTAAFKKGQLPRLLVCGAQWAFVLDAIVLVFPFRPGDDP